MSDFEQKPYVPSAVHEEAAIFADNPDPRCPCILLLDRSGSMAGQPIAELNGGLKTLQRELRADALAAKRVELAIVSFGPVTTDVEFTGVDGFEPPMLTAGGDTPMGRAIETALDLLDRRKGTYKANGISYYRPWVFLITDGGPTDAWQAAARRVHSEEAAKRIAFFAVGTADADFATLSRIAVREPIRLQGLKFSELFKWLSASMAAVSQSQPGAQVALPPPSGWATV
jgi:uncharacterized protein YegL